MEEETVTPKLEARPIFIEDAIPYQLEWSVRPNEQNPDEPIISFGMRYKINPEVMFVVTEICRHQLSEVLASDQAKHPKKRMSMGQKESHNRAIKLLEGIMKGLGGIVYETQLERQEDQRREANGEKVKIEVVSDILTIKKVNKSREDKK